LAQAFPARVWSISLTVQADFATMLNLLHCNVCLLIFCLGALDYFETAKAQDVQVETVADLTQQYPNIFKSGNRNAASHLWSSFILDRAASSSSATIETLFRGFCPISGSPLPDVPHTRYGEVLTRVDGSSVAGISHHCCWPCICDEQDFTRVDKKTVETLDGKVTYDFIVIGDPCQHPAKLQIPFVDPFSKTSVTLEEQAPEVKCDGGRLVGAYHSDGGYPIIGMFYTSSSSMEAHYQNATEFAHMCEQRKSEGYNSGMGLIFDKVAMINVPGAKAGIASLVSADIGDISPQPRSTTAPLVSMSGFLVLVGAAMAIVVFVGTRVVACRRPKMNLSDDESGRASAVDDSADNLECQDTYNSIE